MGLTLNGRMGPGLCLPSGQMTSPRPLAAVFTLILQDTGKAQIVNNFCKEQFAMCHLVSQSQGLYWIFAAANVCTDSGNMWKEVNWLEVKQY